MAANRSYHGLPEFTESYWRASVTLPSFPALQTSTKVDVAIVGGGITGITAAYLLANEGLQVALIDADRLGSGTTGHTTAKLTAQHGLIYNELRNHMGDTMAKLYYEANIGALNFIRQTIHTHQIECDYEQADAYIYATTKEYADKLAAESAAYQDLGLDGGRADTIPLPIAVQNVLYMKKQAQFHPLKYLAPLVQENVAKGGLIFEGTTAVNVVGEKSPSVVTREGHRIMCEKVLTTSHFPFYDKGFYFTRLYAERAYVIAVKPEKDFPGGMFINAETPTRSLRQVSVNNEPLVLVVGETHKAGQGQDHLAHYEALEEFARETVGVKEVKFRWSTQDLTTLDKVPYIGTITANHPNVLVATGFRKWGMTNGTASALLLRDLILKRQNPYQKLFTPARFYPDPSLKTFLSQNANVAAHLIKGKLDLPQKYADQLTNGEGHVVNYNGIRAGGYKDNAGQLYVVDTTCTHLGCEVVWNQGDLTWDCPCHGSRFSYFGNVAEGPAEFPLTKLE